MIIKCEKCESEFSLDEKLIKTGGSKVRCSKCSNVFTVYPPAPEPVQEPTIVERPEIAEEPEVPQAEVSEDFVDENLEETVALDSPPALEESAEEEMEDVDLEDFDKAFEEALEEETIQDVTQEQVDYKGDVAKEARVKADEEKYSTKELFEKAATEEDLLGEIAEQPVSAPRKKKKGVSKVFWIILIIIFILVGGAAAVYFLAPEIIPESISIMKPAKKETVADTDVRRIMFKNVNGSFLESNTAGVLFIIKGIVINGFSKSRSYILIKGMILDDRGEPIKQKLAYAGNAFDEKELSKMTKEAINKGLRNRAGKGNINVNIKPGASIPFMIVFENLPQNVSEFVVEAVSSSPGN